MIEIQLCDIGDAQEMLVTVGMEMGREPSEADWHAERRMGIGGSDAAAALGISPWKTRLELWHEKTAAGDSDRLDSMRLRFGHAAERFVLDEYLRQRPGFTACLWPQRVVCKHPDYSWMLCTPDAVAWSPVEDAIGKGCGIVQIKTASHYVRSEWEDGPPAHYVVQCIHEMAVTGANWCDLVVMFGAGERLEIHRIARNETEIVGLIQLETRFWGDVQAGTQPALSMEEAIAGGSGLGKRLAQVFPAADGHEVHLPQESIHAHQRIEQLSAEIKEREAELEGARNMIRSWLGEATVGILPDGSAYSWKQSERSGYVVAPTVTRVLRHVKGKKQ